MESAESRYVDPEQSKAVEAKTGRETLLGVDFRSGRLEQIERSSSVDERRDMVAGPVEDFEAGR